MIRAAWATDAALARMRQMWIKGDSLDAMGLALGTTANAVIGMVHRCDLPARRVRLYGPPIATCPMIRASAPRADRVVNPVTPPAETPAPKPAIVAAVIEAPAVKADPVVNPVTPQAEMPAPGAAIEAPVVEVPAARPDMVANPVKPVTMTEASSFKRSGRIEPCCWITVMSTKARLPTYCDADSMPGLPYCTKHAATAYPAIKLQLRAQNGADQGSA